MASFGQELATAQAWIDPSSSAADRPRVLAAELLAALWYLSLSDRFIHELLYHNHRYVLDGFVAELRRRGRTLDDAEAVHALGLVRRLSPEDRGEVFEIIQRCVSQAVAWGGETAQ
jgi:hypothetical protein